MMSFGGGGGGGGRENAGREKKKRRMRKKGRRRSRFYRAKGNGRLSIHAESWRERWHPIGLKKLKEGTGGPEPGSHAQKMPSLQSRSSCRPGKMDKRCSDIIREA